MTIDIDNLSAQQACELDLDQLTSTELVDLIDRASAEMQKLDERDYYRWRDVLDEVKDKAVTKMDAKIGRHKQVAIIAPNARGGWSLILPSAGIPLGNYPDAARPSQIALLNGYEPQIQEATRC